MTLKTYGSGDILDYILGIQRIVHEEKRNYVHPPPPPPPPKKKKKLKEHDRQSLPNFENK